MDTKILEEIGLTAGEIKTYLALLKIGSCSTGPLAKESQVSRSKLYSILDKLEKKGLACHIEQSGVTYFQAVEPSKIKDFLRQKETHLKELQVSFERFLPTLEAYHKDMPSHQVRVYQGMKGMITVHEHIYEKVEKGEPYAYMGIPSNQPELHHLYWKRDHTRRIVAGIKCKLLFNKDTSSDTLKDRNSYKNCDARYMPTNIKTPALFGIYKNTVIIMLQTPTVLSIEIINQHIADSFQSYFDAFWKESKPFRL